MTHEELEGALRSTPDPREREYRPRHLPTSLVAGQAGFESSRGRSRRLLAMSVAGVPLAVIVVVAVLVLGNLTAPPAAFAGWTAMPTSTDPAVAEIVEDACRKFLQHPADDPNFERRYNEEQRRKISAWPDPAKETT